MIFFGHAADDGFARLEITAQVNVEPFAEFLGIGERIPHDVARSLNQNGALDVIGCGFGHETTSWLQIITWRAFGQCGVLRVNSPEACGVYGAARPPARGLTPPRSPTSSCATADRAKTP